MTREEALDALQAAGQIEDEAESLRVIGEIIENYGGLPFEPFRGWQKLLPLPSLFGNS